MSSRTPRCGGRLQRCPRPPARQAAAGRGCSEGPVSTCIRRRILHCWS
jgi:hypothetical protein